MFLRRSKVSIEETAVFNSNQPKPELAASNPEIKKAETVWTLKCVISGQWVPKQDV